jgi:hypothetical protein
MEQKLSLGTDSQPVAQPTSERKPWRFVARSDVGGRISTAPLIIWLVKRMTLHCCCPCKESLNFR